MDRAARFGLVMLAVLAESCGPIAAPAKPKAAPAEEYVFPATMPDQTSVCVAVYRPMLRIGCVSLKRLRSIVFDLEAD